MTAASEDRQRDKKLEDILRLIELCRNIQSSSVNPFEVDIREKLRSSRSTCRTGMS